MKTRILLLWVDACWNNGFDDGCARGLGGLTPAQPCPPCMLLDCHQAERDGDPDRRVAADVERVWVRGPVSGPSRGMTLASSPQGCRWPCADRRSCFCGTRWDKHRLDLALSAGRHAAERARLAGIGRLVGRAPRLDAGAPGVCPGFGCGVMSEGLCVDPYERLCCAGHPEIAALVGVAIAGAQMGLSVHLPGPLGAVAARAALGLNPGIRGWLDVSRAAQLARARPIPILGIADPG